MPPPPTLNREEINCDSSPIARADTRTGEDANLLLSLSAPLSTDAPPEDSDLASNVPLPEESDCPSVAFGKSLKTFGDIEYQPHVTKPATETVKGVVGFDVDKYNKYCSPKSPFLDSTLDLNLIAGEVFKSHEVWVNRELPYEALRAQAGMFNNVIVYFVS